MTTLEPLSRPSSLPTAKVAATGTVGAVTVLLVWILGQFHLVVPGDVGSAITVVCSGLAGYFIKERRAAPRT
jgi:hypothetical protein